MERFIVGIDGSASSEDALRWATDEARLRDGTVTAVLAWSFVDQYHADGQHRFDPDYDEETARGALDAAVERALGDRADEVSRLVVCDLPSAALLAAAQDATMLVVGARGLGGVRGVVLGSVSQRCLEHAPCPVTVVRDAGRGRARGDRVVVGVDGSESSHAALGWAAEEARLRDAKLEVVHAWEVPPVAELAFVGGAYEAMAQSATDVAEQAPLGIEMPADVIRTVVQDHPARAILAAAAGADLVVVGTRGRGGFAGLLLGSVSHQVSRHADCPVVVIPAPHA